MLALHLVISALIAVLSVVIVCIAHSKVVEHDIEELKKNPILIEARHHSYIPLFVSVELDEDEYEDFDFDKYAQKVAKTCQGKLQNRIDRILWWSDFSSTKFDNEVNKLSHTARTRAARKYLTTLKPKNMSALIITKNLRNSMTSESKSYTWAIAQKYINNTRFTSIDPQTRFAVMKHDNFKCTHCGRFGLDVELHVMRDNMGYYTTVCKDCYKELNSET